MVTGIFMMIAVSILGVMILQFSALSNAQKSQAFLRAQAELYARSAIEQAVLQLRSGNESDINITAGEFDVNVTIESIDGVAYKVGVVSEYTAAPLAFPIRYTRQTVQIP